jgi:tRNA(Ile)-lysidine synthase
MSEHIELARCCRPLLDRCQFPPPGTTVSCAVSGGADSLALLALAVTAELHVTAIHVDHGLRLESTTEAETVRLAAGRWGADFRAEQVTIEQGPNLEARARAARYGVLPVGVMTGHTADDQAETVLINLLRGSGLDGLAGMNPQATSPQRPILGLRRSETQALCADLGVEPVADPSNLDARFRRNRVRQELLPLMNDIAERDLVEILTRQANLLRDEAVVLDELAATLDPTDALAVSGAAPAVARRALRGWLTPQLGGKPPDSAAIERVMAVARGESIACELSEGVRIERHRQRLSVRRR